VRFSKEAIGVANAMGVALWVTSAAEWTVNAEAMPSAQRAWPHWQARIALLD